MIDLDLLRHKDQLKVKREADKRMLFDPVRRKWVVLQPEELVRQLVIRYLLVEKGYNQNRIGVEKGLKVNDLNKRCDLLVYDGEVQPFLLVECKAPDVDITQGTFKQIAWYNMPLKVPYLMVTNGIRTFCCEMDYEKHSYAFIEKVPDYPGEP